MTHKRYERYKDSGIEWIGEVPEDWAVDRLKKSVKMLKNGAWGDEPQGDGNDIACVRVADFNRDNFEVEDKDFTVRNLDKNKQKMLLLKKDDLLIEKSGGGEKQPVGFVVKYSFNKPAIYTNFIAKMDLDKQIAFTVYFKYVHATLYFQKINVRSIKQTTGIQNLDATYYLQELSPYPPLTEQKAIADYLNQKTSEIDSLISDKEKLIQRLQEYKQSVITEAVTKGLNPDVKMKDSGIEWIGEIPEHWEIKKISWLFDNISSGATPDTSNEDYYDGEIPWLNTGDLNDGEIFNTKKYITDLALKKYSAIKLYPPNVLVIAMYGATIGKLGITKIPLTANQACCVLSNPKRANNKFVYYWFLAKRRQIISMSYGGGQPNISQNLISSLRVCLPEIKEQEEIIYYIDRKVEKINELIIDIQFQIEKLKEYRQSLIYEAVTGKIDVRGYAPERSEELAQNSPRLI